MLIVTGSSRLPLPSTHPEGVWGGLLPAGEAQGWGSEALPEPGGPLGS